MKLTCIPHWFRLATLLCLLLPVLRLPVHAQPTAFTYDGFLSEAGLPLHGLYDLRFELRDAVTAGNLVTAPLTIARVPVVNGIFSVTLDFGPGAFTGAPRWLETGMRTNGSPAAFTLLPRVQFLSAPYAVRAIEAGTLANPLAENLLPAVVARLNAPQTFTGAPVFAPAAGPPFTVGAGNTALVPNLNVELLGGMRATNFWQLGGNAGTVAGTHFLGTADNQPLELKVNGQRALRLIPNATSPNVVGGFSGNAAVAGGAPGFVVVGGTVGGGGAAGAVNFVGSSFSTVGGGSGNTILREATDGFSTHNTIAGGSSNIIDGDLNAYNFIAGGRFNSIGGLANSENTIGGGRGYSMGSEVGVSTIAVGSSNVISAVVGAASIGGGSRNAILNDSHGATISGGTANAIKFESEDSFIGGGLGNVILSYAKNAVIAGGQDNLVNGAGNGSRGVVIGGGRTNVIERDSSYSTIGGGASNRVAQASAYAAIGGGQQNVIQTNATHAVIAGGSANGIETNAPFTVIGGGQGNTIGHSSAGALVSGGLSNRVDFRSPQSAVVGGTLNVAGIFRHQRLRGRRGVEQRRLPDAQLRDCGWHRQLD